MTTAAEWRQKIEDLERRLADQATKLRELKDENTAELEARSEIISQRDRQIDGWRESLEKCEARVKAEEEARAAVRALYDKAIRKLNRIEAQHGLSITRNVFLAEDEARERRQRKLAQDRERERQRLARKRRTAKKRKRRAW